MKERKTEIERYRKREGRKEGGRTFARILVRHQEPSQHTLDQQKVCALALTCLRNNVLPEISSC